MKKLVFTALLGLLTLSCSPNDELYSPNEQDLKSDLTLQKGGSPVATEWVDLEFTETQCQTSKKRYQARAISSALLNRDRTVSFKITDVSTSIELYNGQYTIAAGNNVSAFGEVFPNTYFAANIKYEVTDVVISPYYLDSNGNPVYQPLIGLYQYKDGQKDVINCQVPIFN